MHSLDKCRMSHNVVDEGQMQMRLEAFVAHRLSGKEIHPGFDPGHTVGSFLSRQDIDGTDDAVAVIIVIEIVVVWRHGCQWDQDCQVAMMNG